MTCMLVNHYVFLFSGVLEGDKEICVSLCIHILHIPSQKGEPVGAMN